MMWLLSLADAAIEIVYAYLEIPMTRKSGKINVESKVQDSFEESALYKKIGQIMNIVLNCWQGNEVFRIYKAIRQRI